MKDIKQKILSVLEGGEILIIVPPFGSIRDICLGPHILQVLAKENGYNTDILYLNILLASIIGVERYEEIYFAPEFWMIGERLFARSAYGFPPLGHNPDCCANEAMSISGSKTHAKMFYEDNPPFNLEEYLKTEHLCKSFIDELMPVFTSLDYKIIGCTNSMTRQTNCSIALLSGVKKHCPQTITIIGGSNCKGEMAKGIASLSNDIDYIFSGESETTFLNFLKSFFSKELPTQRIISAEPLYDLDTLPLPEYEIFYNQYMHFLGENALSRIKIWYETSRGCWWDQCSFCSTQHISYRIKSINKVVRDIKRIKESYPDKMLFITDIVIPNSYHKELLPVVSNKEEFPSLAYQLRAIFDLKGLVKLKNAKIEVILPGLETFSTNLLRLMNKGITGRQSLLFLRNAVSVGIYSDWFLLWGFPGDKISDYEEVLCILPLIRHLQPPRKFYPMILMRFSPYLNDHQRYKIKNIRPWEAFNMIYPGWADIGKLAAYFIGEFPCEANENPKIIREIARELAVWEKTWRSTKLLMKHLMDTYVIYDNRDIHKNARTHVLDYQQAKEIMTSCVYQDSKNLKLAVEEKLGVVIDSWYVPLVTASPELLLKFEE